MRHILYDCGCCENLHPWTWDGDCRDDANRFPAPEVYAELHSINVNDVELRSMEERLEADERGEP